MDGSEWWNAAPLVIAHRGASAIAPENTLPAFERAAALGADAIELDSKLTRDGVVVAFHDRTLTRTTGESGQVGQRTWAELRELDVGRWKGAEFSGVTIPRLEAILEAVGARVLVNIELTDYWRDQRALAERVVDVVKRQGMTGRVLLSSFQSSALRAAHRAAPGIPRARLSGPTWLAVRDRLPQRRAPVEALHPHESIVTPRWIGRAHARGLRVNVFTVNDPATMDSLWGWGADGVITDTPDAALLARARRGTR